MQNDKALNEEELKKRLTPEQYRVLREKGTEAPFTGKYYNSHEQGMYTCAVCGNELFSSDAKFDSGTGWPSFTDPANLEHIELREDTSHGTRLPAPDGAADGGQVARTEVLCKNCGSHLGHVFDDLPETYGSPPESLRRTGGRAGGPSPTGKRYCINSVCLDLKRKNHGKEN